MAIGYFIILSTLMKDTISISKILVKIMCLGFFSSAISIFIMEIIKIDITFFKITTYISVYLIIFGYLIAVLLYSLELIKGLFEEKKSRNNDLDIKSAISLIAFIVQLTLICQLIYGYGYYINYRILIDSSITLIDLPNFFYLSFVISYTLPINSTVYLDYLENISNNSYLAIYEILLVIANKIIDGVVIASIMSYIGNFIFKKKVKK